MFKLGLSWVLLMRGGGNSVLDELSKNWWFHLDLHWGFVPKLRIKNCIVKQELILLLECWGHLLLFLLLNNILLVRRRSIGEGGKWCHVKGFVAAATVQSVGAHRVRLLKGSVVAGRSGGACSLLGGC